MMTQRFNLFYAGFTAYLPALYFNRLWLASRYASGGEGELPCVRTLRQDTEQQWDEYLTHLKTAESIADHFQIVLLQRPRNFSDYFSWLTHLTEQFEKQFPMSRIDHYYFLYARKLAEIICNSALIATYADLHVDSGGQLNMHSGIEKCLRDNEYILFKLVASSALLSSEPRHLFFNSNYKKINDDFQEFRHLNPVEMEAEALRKLGSRMNAYSLNVMEGFKGCIGALKELQF